MTLRIRPCAEADLPAVADLWRACRLVVPHNDPAEDISFCRSSGHGEVFVGERDGAVVATAMTGHEGHRGGVYYVAVRPERRGGGLGERMRRPAEGWPAAQGVPKVQRMVRESNAAAGGFYERIGDARQPVVVLGRWLRQ